MPRKKSETYVVKGVPISIKFTSRASIKVGDSFYTIEACEERSIPTNIAGLDIEAERKALWDTVNSECDKQIEDILTTFKK